MDIYKELQKEHEETIIELEKLQGKSRVLIKKLKILNQRAWNRKS
jgi:hypothetical protein